MSARPILAELRRLAEAGERVAAALEAIAERDRPGPDARFARLLAAAFQALGSETFTAARLRELADSPLSTRAALRLAIGSASAKGLGRLLAKNAGAVRDGLRLERAAEGRPARWRISALEMRERRRASNPWRL